MECSWCMKHETKGLVAHDIITRYEASKIIITKVRKLSQKQIKKMPKIIIKMQSSHDL
jgi:hypothetical protein